MGAFALAPIKVGSGNPSTGEGPKVIRPNEPITQKDGNWTDEEWADLRRDGVIGDQKHPDGLLNSDLSPFRYRVHEVLQAHEAAMDQAIRDNPPFGVSAPEQPEATKK